MFKSKEFRTRERPEYRMEIRNSMSSRIPILVGSGQITHKTKTLDDFIHPIEFMKRAIERAAEDAECKALVEKADALHVVNILSWSHKNAPEALAEALGIQPNIQEYTSVGGNNPQWLVNRAADNLAAGHSEIAILAGCEVMRSVSIAMKSGKDLGFFRDRVEITMVGINRPGTHEVENAHFADRPIRIYPLIENALRAKEGLTIEQEREQLGKFGESYSAVAAKNPYAWFPIARTAQEIVTPGPNNRMIGFPYTKYLNAVMEVDQSAAVIMTTAEKARALGIPESKWVYLHGGQDAHDHWFLSNRSDIADSPAIKAAVGDALAQSGITLEQINFFDFYSCFPCMPRLSRDVLGIPHDDPRPMTITGGLPYFGGAGNNYVMHSIAEAMNRCRADRDAYGMITSNGFYSTKHGVGIYGGQAPKKSWKRTQPEEFQQTVPLAPPLEIDAEPSGDFLVDGYTVWHDRDGQPEVGILIGRTSSGKRAWAQTRKDNKELMAAMMKEEWCGKRGKIGGKSGKANLVEF